MDSDCVGQVPRYHSSRGSSDFEDISPAKVHVRPNDVGTLGAGMMLQSQ